MNDSPGRAGMALVAAALYLLVCLFVQSVKVAAQFAGQDKLVVSDRMAFFQIFLM